MILGTGALKLAAAMADKPMQRKSLKKKLEMCRAQVAGTGRVDNDRAKRKEKTLQAKEIHKNFVAKAVGKPYNVKRKAGGNVC